MKNIENSSKKNKLKKLKSILENAKKLEEIAQETKKDECKSDGKMTEKDFKVYINGTYAELQMTTKW